MIINVFSNCTECGSNKCYLSIKKYKEQGKYEDCCSCGNIDKWKMNEYKYLLTYYTSDFVKTFEWFETEEEMNKFINKNSDDIDVIEKNMF